MLLIGSFAIVFTAALTWFYSTRPRLYLWTFVPQDHRIRVARWAFRQAFCRDMRRMAILQFAVGCGVGLVELWLRL